MRRFLLLPAQGRLEWTGPAAIRRINAIRTAWRNHVEVYALEAAEEENLTRRQLRRRAGLLPGHPAQQGARPKSAGQSQAGEIAGEPESTTRELRPTTSPTRTSRHHARRPIGAMGGRGGLFFRILTPVLWTSVALLWGISVGIALYRLVAAP